MKCPVCSNTSLVMSERQGIEIDYCPDCRGVWLDRGELDKIIERSAPAPTAASPQQPEYSNSGHRGHYDKHSNKHYKRKSFLSELFD